MRKSHKIHATVMRKSCEICQEVLRKYSESPLKGNKKSIQNPQEVFKGPHMVLKKFLENNFKKSNQKVFRTCSVNKRKVIKNISETPLLERPQKVQRKSKESPKKVQRKSLSSPQNVFRKSSERLQKVFRKYSKRPHKVLGKS